jgi:hypothetical protein
MLIVNADDWGRSLVQADAALRCLKKREDHICQCDGFQAGFRARCRAGESKLIAVGLRLNFSEEFTNKERSEKLRENTTSE